jgi:ABC-type polar amino acid transport system ATPase subunit
MGDDRSQEDVDTNKTIAKKYGRNSVLRDGCIEVKRSNFLSISGKSSHDEPTDHQIID